MILTNNIRVGLDDDNMSKLRAVLFAKVDGGLGAFNESEQVCLALHVVDEGLVVARQYMNVSTLLTIRKSDCIRLKQVLNDFWGMAEAFVEDDELVVSGTVNNGYSERNISGVRLCNFNIAKCDISLLVHGNGIGLSSDRDVYESMKLVMFISKKCMSELLDLREFAKCTDETTTSKESIMTTESICANIRLDDNFLVIERYDLDKEMKFCMPPYVIKYLIEKFETGRVKFAAIDADEAEDRLAIKVYSYRDYRCQATIDIYDSSVSYWDWGVSLDDEYDFEVEL